MAEWLGKALQKPVRGFDSLWYLTKPSHTEGFCVGEALTSVHTWDLIDKIYRLSPI